VPDKPDGGGWEAAKRFYIHSCLRFANKRKSCFSPSKSHLRREGGETSREQAILAAAQTPPATPPRAACRHMAGEEFYSWPRTVDRIFKYKII